MLVYIAVATINVAGKKPIIVPFLAREEDIGAPNKARHWRQGVETGLRATQVSRGQKGHEKTTLEVEVYGAFSELPELPILKGKRKCFPAKILSLAQPE